MAQRSIFTAREAEFLNALVHHDVNFMIVGLSAAILQGAPGVTQDIDLWFRDLNDQRLIDALEQVGAVLVPQIGLNPPMLAGDGVSLFDLVVQMSGLEPFDQEIENAVDIEIGGVTVRVLGIERIIASKEAANREKDRLVLPVLRDAAITLRDLRKKSEGS